MLLINEKKLTVSNKLGNKTFFERRVYLRLKVIDFNINVEIGSTYEKKTFKAEVINIGNNGISII